MAGDQRPPGMLATPQGFEPRLVFAGDEPASATLDFIFRGPELLTVDTCADLPGAAAVATLALGQDRWLPMGRLAGKPGLPPLYCRAAWVDAATEPPPGHAFHGLRSLFSVLPSDLMGIAGRASQLVEWDRTHRYCGRCGSRTLRVEGERSVRCPECHHQAYPRISPAMMVLVRRGGDILLARHARLPTGRFTALAGFVEAGETIEEAIHREVAEEVGLRVRDLKYFGSQSWPFPHSLMIAFTAEFDGGEMRLDPGEITEARWFGPGDPRPDSPPAYTVSIAHALINTFWPGGGSRPA